MYNLNQSYGYNPVYRQMQYQGLNRLNYYKPKTYTAQTTLSQYSTVSLIPKRTIRPITRISKVSKATTTLTNRSAYTPYLPYTSAFTSNYNPYASYNRYQKYTRPLVGLAGFQGSRYLYTQPALAYSRSTQKIARPPNQNVVVQQFKQHEESELKRKQQEEEELGIKQVQSIIVNPEDLMKM